MFRTAERATHRAPGRAVIDYRGLAAPVGKGVGGAAVIGAVSATAALAGGASATAQAPAAPAASAAPSAGTAAAIPAAASAVAPASTQYTSVKLRLGSRGSAVSYLQQRLNAHGASLKVDGVFGSATLRAVKNRQSAAGIGVDGVVGPKTWNALYSGVSIPSGGTGASSGTTVNGSAIVSAARAQLGVRYKWGGSTPSSGLDCSGLVYHAYNQAGMNMPRKTAKGYTFGGRIIPKSQAKPGDLVAFTGNDYGHMGIYTGGNGIIDASGSRQQVVERTIWNAPHVFVTYR